ncbi:MAG: prephenate/arogenate dehydrogenase family protein [Rhodospirillaceae bacterium]|jgi:cyclohexadieny/prephenate dehydrogenase|nr:prephenate/arogenate dehydrogenase family protein [Rhodospirillaceae bacterium]
MSNKPLFDRVALIGLGLIGSSLGHAMKRDGLAGHVAGSARTEDTCAKALEIGFVDSASVDPVEAVANADLIVICTPVGVIADVAALIAPTLKSGAIVTDVGSVKMAVIRDVGPLLPDGVHLVPGHPVAGTEHSGPESGFPELFEGRYCILTPPPGANEDAVDAVAELWRSVGSDVEIMDPKHHDRVLAITSHLPHLLAYTIVGTASDLEDHIGKEAAANKEDVLTSEVIKFSAGGFRDFTRIAASDPVMWRDIFLNNREAVLEILGRFTEDLTALQRAIRWGEGDALHDMFERTRGIRRGVIEMRQAGTFKATEQESEASEDPES